jgi:hypothetical protein
VVEGSWLVGKRLFKKRERKKKEEDEGCKRKRDSR